MSYTAKDLEMAQETQTLEGYGTVPVYYITPMERWPDGLGLSCHYCDYRWIPDRPPKACPRCKRYFWKGRWPRIVVHSRVERMQGPDEITAEDPNRGQMIDIHYFTCEDCGADVPYALHKPSSEETCCVDCLKIALEDREAAREDVTTDRPDWEREEFGEAPPRVTGHLPEFGEDVITSGTCTHCTGLIDNDMAQKASDGSLYCGPCLSFYMSEGRLPTGEEVSQRLGKRE